MGEFSDDEDDGAQGMHHHHHQDDDDNAYNDHMAADNLMHDYQQEQEGGMGPDETQGAAEAMVQLAGSYQYYQDEEEGERDETGGDTTMEVDASYDPAAEFLGGMMPTSCNDQESNINNDLEVSDSDDEEQFNQRLQQQQQQ